MFFPKLYGCEFLILPIIALPYLYYIADFTLPASLFNNAIVTLVCGAVALWRSKAIAGSISKGKSDRLEPVWPALIGILLIFLAALQVIFSVAHLSYYRDGPLVHDIFER